MPEKRHKCGKRCPRCWRNNLKHGNPITKRWLAKQAVQTSNPFVTEVKPAFEGEVKEPSLYEKSTAPGASWSAVQDYIFSLPRTEQRAILQRE